MSLNPADESFVASLNGVVPTSVFRPVEPRYLEEPRGRLNGQGGLLACPHNTHEVSALIKAANAARVGVVPYGGGTGLVGAQVMPEGPAPLILSLERMAHIRAVHPEENVIVTEAGAVLADVQAAARGADRLFPLSLASEGSARIGGNLATNAGGVNVLRYGNARDLCLGLEAVLPDGCIWNGLTRLRKDNTGYDLRNLLIGSEGTLGVITAAALKLAPIPAATGTAILVVPSPRAAIDLLSLARDMLGEGISAFELLHRQGLEFLSETLPDIRQPFPDPPEWSVLIELGLIAALDPREQLANLFEVALGQGLVLDGLIAQSEAQRDGFWAVREQMPEANRRIGSVSSHDVSIPLGALAGFIEKGRETIAGFGTFRINCFGHVGDGNLHYNVFPPKGADRADYSHQGGAIKRAVHDLVADFNGSISAEHGIGRIKVDDLERYGDPVKLSAMRAIKMALDPQGIMNPGAVLRI
ncbi:FAD-binding oxidoreductase [Sedimentitalea todarodis]|uniref:FAD-binding oxidoreductase n=1 Tax=Sedimentitalea todarodis TaxID=1631240 RepID=A0ABU3V8K1_9RHOB|nr:FAD-binding oxidoreductase [Sedimentitalea todarodis]MDU9002492.1 FAD-binding oxidoreductase [Sedimentitalea todarodis]